MLLFYDTFCIITMTKYILYLPAGKLVQK